MAITGTVRTLIGIVREEDVPFKAAGITYYAIASFIPLLVVALALLSVFGATGTLIETLQSVLPESGSDVLETTLTNIRAHSAAGGIGLLIALWSGSKIFRGLAIAFDGIYQSHADLSLVDQLKKSLLALGAIFVGFVLVSVLSVVLTFVAIPIQYPTVVGNVLAVVVLSLAFLPIFYFMPPVKVSIQHALPGAVLTAIGWVLLQYGFFYYASNAGRYAAYGFLGAILLFITFLYFGAIVLLLGAAMNVALNERAVGRPTRAATDA